MLGFEIILKWGGIIIISSLLFADILKIYCKYLEISTNFFQECRFVFMHKLVKIWELFYYRHFRGGIFMKRLGMIAIALIAFVVPVLANEHTIITVPLDSRPISIEYLENLVTLGGDKFVCIDPEHLDKYNSYDEPAYASGDSSKIRQQLSDLVNENNNTNTSVIINLTSTVYGGLIESRQFIDQDSIDSAAENLEQLMTYAPNPTYYLHMSMPRTLPDSRATAIWPDSEPLQGLGYYYLEEFPDTKGIRDTVPADEFLLEWGYVENKRLEMGDESLFSWETKFLENFNTKYFDSNLYKKYIVNYQNLYVQASDLVKKMIDLVTTLQADELVISVDDYQLPVFVQALIMNNLATPPIDENGEIIKFSWARKYLESDQNSVYRYHASKLGEQSLQDSVEGLGEQVNYIFGTDEIPQMIYARDLAKRYGVTTSFLPVNTHHLGGDNLNDTGAYDVLSTDDLYTQRLNFVSCQAYAGEYHYDVVHNIYSKPFQFYINKYNCGRSDLNSQRLNSMVLDIFNSYNRGNHVGVIELYNDNVNMREDRVLVNKLLNENFFYTLGLVDNSIGQLATYSSWNTEGNAIGLAIAHAQVFGIVDMQELDYVEALERGKAQYEILLQHLIEDNLYTASVKSHVDINDYEIIPKDMVNSKLLGQMPVLELLEIFMKEKISLAGHEISYEDITIVALSFPWLRTFDLFVDLEIN